MLSENTATSRSCNHYVSSRKAVQAASHMEMIQHGRHHSTDIGRAGNIPTYFFGKGDEHSGAECERRQPRPHRRYHDRQSISGRVGYAMLNYGSFLGMGGKLFALPWEILKYDTVQRVCDRFPDERLKSAPSSMGAGPSGLIWAISPGARRSTIITAQQPTGIERPVGKHGGSVGGRSQSRSRRRRAMSLPYSASRCSSGAA